MSVLNAEENGQISIHHFLYHFSAVACADSDSEQKDFDFSIIGKKELKWVVGQIGRKQAGMALVLQRAF